jgi:hypothetical protein
LQEPHEFIARGTPSPFAPYFPTAALQLNEEMPIPFTIDQLISHLLFFNIIQHHMRLQNTLRNGSRRNLVPVLEERYTQWLSILHQSALDSTIQCVPPIDVMVVWYAHMASSFQDYLDVLTQLFGVDMQQAILKIAFPVPVSTAMLNENKQAWAKFTGLSWELDLNDPFLLPLRSCQVCATVNSLHYDSDSSHAHGCTACGKKMAASRSNLLNPDGMLPYGIVCKYSKGFFGSQLLPRLIAFLDTIHHITSCLDPLGLEGQSVSTLSELMCFALDAKSMSDSLDAFDGDEDRQTSSLMILAAWTVLVSFPFQFFEYSKLKYDRLVTLSPEEYLSSLPIPGKRDWELFCDRSDSSREANSSSLYFPDEFGEYTVPPVPLELLNSISPTGEAIPMRSLSEGRTPSDVDSEFDASGIWSSDSLGLKEQSPLFGEETDVSAVDSMAILDSYCQEEHEISETTASDHLTVSRESGSAIIEDSISSLLKVEFLLKYVVKDPVQIPHDDMSLHQITFFENSVKSPIYIKDPSSSCNSTKNFEDSITPTSIRDSEDLNCDNIGTQDVSNSLPNDSKRLVLDSVESNEKYLLGINAPKLDSNFAMLEDEIGVSQGESPRCSSGQDSLGSTHVDNSDEKRDEEMQGSVSTHTHTNDGAESSKFESVSPDLGVLSHSNSESSISELNERIDSRKSPNEVEVNLTGEKVTPENQNASPLPKVFPEESFAQSSRFTNKTGHNEGHHNAVDFTSNDLENDESKILESRVVMVPLATVLSDALVEIPDDNPLPSCVSFSDHLQSSPAIAPAIAPASPTLEQSDSVPEISDLLSDVAIADEQMVNSTLEESGTRNIPVSAHQSPDSQFDDLAIHEADTPVQGRLGNCSNLNASQYSLRDSEVYTTAPREVDPSTLSSIPTSVPNTPVCSDERTGAQFNNNSEVTFGQVKASSISNLETDEIVISEPLTAEEPSGSTCNSKSFGGSRNPLSSSLERKEMLPRRNKSQGIIRRFSRSKSNATLNRLRDTLKFRGPVSQDDQKSSRRSMLMYLQPDPSHISNGYLVDLNSPMISYVKKNPIKLDSSSQFPLYSLNDERILETSLHIASLGKHFKLLKLLIPLASSLSESSCVLAESRYLKWLMLLSGANKTTFIPPPDVALVWHVHCQDPLHMYKDLCKVVGSETAEKCMKYSLLSQEITFSRSSTMKSKEIWESYTGESYILGSYSKQASCIISCPTCGTVQCLQSSSMTQLSQSSSKVLCSACSVAFGRADLTANSRRLFVLSFSLFQRLPIWLAQMRNLILNVNSNSLSSVGGHYLKYLDLAVVIRKPNGVGAPQQSIYSLCDSNISIALSHATHVLYPGSYLAYMKNRFSFLGNAFALPSGCEFMSGYRTPRCRRSDGPSKILPHFEKEDLKTFYIFCKTLVCSGEFDFLLDSGSSKNVQLLVNQRIFCAKAEMRYAAYLKMASSFLQQGSVPPLPPLDVLVVWLVHLLDPDRYAEDLDRFIGTENMYFLHFPLQDIASCLKLSDSSLNSLVWRAYVSSEDVHVWSETTNQSFLLDNQELYKDILISCPYCCSDQLWGAKLYAGFLVGTKMVVCEACGKAITVSSMSACRLIVDLCGSRDTRSIPCGTSINVLNSKISRSYAKSVQKLLFSTQEQDIASLLQSMVLKSNSLNPWKDLDLSSQILGYLERSMELSEEFWADDATQMAQSVTSRIVSSYQNVVSPFSSDLAAGMQAWLNMLNCSLMAFESIDEEQTWNLVSKKYSDYLTKLSRSSCVSGLANSDSQVPSNIQLAHWCHILDSALYRDFCSSLFGRTVELTGLQSKVRQLQPQLNVFQRALISTYPELTVYLQGSLLFSLF